MATIKDFGYESKKIQGKENKRPLLLILVDTNGTGLAHTADYYDELVFNWQKKSVNGYFFDNSNERFLFTRAGIIGPLILSSQDMALRFEERLGRIKELAIQTGFDFSQFDRDSNNLVENKELVILIIDNGSVDFGAKRQTIPYAPPANSTGLSLQADVAVVGHQIGFATLNHEIAHILGTLDLYFDTTTGSSTGNLKATLMGATVWGTADDRQIFHLDPWHKMTLGWIEPQVYDMENGNNTFSLSIPVASSDASSPLILFDSNKGHNEYFMLEYRSGTASKSSIYDENVCDNGLIIWHIVPDGTNGGVPKVFTRGGNHLEIGGGKAWHSGEETPTLKWIDNSDTLVSIKVDTFTSKQNSITIHIKSRRNPKIGLSAWKGIEGDQGIYYAGFDGANWQAQKRVVGVGTSVGPSLAVFNGKFYMAWKGVNGDQGIYYSSFDGVNWQAQKSVTGVGTNIGPSLAVFNGKLYMAWKGVNGDQGIYYSGFDGTNWQAQKRVIGVGTNVGPSLAVFNGKLYMAWKGVNGDEGIYYSGFDGSNWQAQKRVVGVGTNVGPSLAVFNGKLYMAWKGINGDQGIYYSSFDGSNWQGQRGVAGVGTSVGPSLEVFNDQLYMAWKGVNGDQGIYYSSFDGTNWQPQRRVTGVGTSFRPALSKWI